MTTTKLAPKAQAHQHVLAALATGVRGELRDALREAERLSAPTPTARTLTDLQYRNLSPGQKLIDPDRSGLLMRHGKRTGKVWVFRYAHPTTGKQVEFQFGTYPEMTVTEARERWTELRATRNAGDDPAAITENGEDMAAAALTVSDLADRYINDYARPTKRSWAEDERLLHRHLVPVYGSIPATGFCHREAAQLLNAIHKAGTPREAEKVRAVISTMYAVAVGKTRKISTLEGTWLPPTTDNPVKNVLLPRHKAQNHKPTRTELAGFLARLDKLPNGDVLRLQAMTMTRIGEAAGLVWSELDLEEGRWDLPPARAKNGYAHLVLLPKQAIDLLVRIKSEQETKELDTPCVFPSSRIPSQPVATNYVQNQLSRARVDMGLPNAFKTHSLRHAALTWAAENGCPRDVRDRLTNHISGGGVDAIYNGAALNQPAKEWWQRWADYLDTLTQPNVVPLKVRA